MSEIELISHAKENSALSLFFNSQEGEQMRKVIIDTFVLMSVRLIKYAPGGRAEDGYFLGGRISCSSATNRMQLLKNEKVIQDALDAQFNIELLAFEESSSIPTSDEAPLFEITYVLLFPWHTYGFAKG